MQKCIGGTGRFFQYRPPEKQKSTTCKRVSRLRVYLRNLMHCYTFRESEQKPRKSNEVHSELLSEYKILRNSVIVVMYFKPRFSKARWCPKE